MMIEIDNIFKKFGEKEVLKGINAQIGKGEIFTIIGPSGQGKSTLLRIINMLEKPDAGTVRIDGADIFSTKSPQMTIRRKMAMVFQKPAMFNTTVFENIAIGLKFRGIPETEIQKRVEKKLDEVDLTGYSGRKAGTLSGGEMQRVALARSMVSEPDILILDEPTANLDPVATENIEYLIRHFNREYNTTIVMSTHDMVQGQRLADRIAVMMNGTFSQIGTPREVFSMPNNKEVAKFIGIENIIEGVIVGKEGGIADIDASGITVRGLTDLPVGEHVCGCIRPEDITLHRSHGKRISALNVFTGTILAITAVGPLNNIIIDCGFNISAAITWKSSQELNITVGSRLIISFKASAIHVMKDTTGDY